VLTALLERSAGGPNDESIIRVTSFEIANSGRGIKQKRFHGVHEALVERAGEWQRATIESGKKGNGIAVVSCTKPCQVLPQDLNPAFARA
jgi:hypothetical protein